MKVGFYVSEEELTWLRREGPGWFRRMLQHFMKKYPDGMPAENEERT
jgi:hypothetical protein